MFLISIICCTILAYKTVLLNFHVAVFSCTIISLTEMLLLLYNMQYNFKHMKITYILANVLESTATFLQIMLKPSTITFSDLTICAQFL